MTLTIAGVGGTYAYQRAAAAPAYNGGASASHTVQLVRAELIL